MRTEGPGPSGRAGSGVDPILGWELKLEGEPACSSARLGSGGMSLGFPGELPEWSARLGPSKGEGVDFSLHLDLNGGSQGFGPLEGEDFPAPGQMVAGFRILRELGRGAFARVYLSEQQCLANRRVALKVARQSIGEESRILARLQHSHIVPLLSVHEDPATGWSLLCMPYLGGANLAQVLDRTRAESGAAPWRGADLIRALDVMSGRIARKEARSATSGDRTRVREGATGSTRVSSRTAHSSGSSLASSTRSRLGRYLAHVSPWSMGSGQPAEATSEEDSDERQPGRLFLRRASGIQSAVWIATRLAEGLEHAHSRGLLHRDLKPSNILITAEATPMILDFNLSAESEMREASGGLRQRLGGTLPYMAPEHLDAFNPRGSTSPESVDERSDVYALGLILFEMATGRPPFQDVPPGLPASEQLERMIEDRKAVPSARSMNPEIPWSLESILRRSLEPEPVKRYQTAGQVAEDLQRYLDDRPLKHARELSLRECVKKWTRRNPRLVASTNMGILATVLLLLLASLFGVVGRNLMEARARIRYDEFQSKFARAQFLLNLTGGARDHLGEGIEEGGKLLSSFGAGGDELDWMEGPLVRPLTERQRLDLREKISELMLLIARARVTRSEKVRDKLREPVLAEAIRWLDRAEALDPRPPGTLFADRARYYAALGMDEEAKADARRASAARHISARDYQLVGTSLLSRGRPDAAEPCLARAVAMDSRLVWAWFALGFCHSDQGRWSEAASDFANCTVLQDRFAWSHYNRGLALQRTNRLVEAKLSFDHAVRLDGHLLEALYNRALVELELGEAAAALVDLEVVLKEGWRAPEILVARAEALSKLGRGDQAELEFGRLLAEHPDDPDALIARGFSRLSRDPAGSEGDFAHALRVSPRSARARLGLAHVYRERKPEEALGHLDEALEAEPGQTDALQLRAVLRGRMGMRSAIDDALRLQQVPTPLRLYNAACALAWLQRTTGDEGLIDETLRVLGRAFETGFSVAIARRDEAFDSIQDRAEYRRLINGYSVEAGDP